MPDDARTVLIRYGECFRQQHEGWPAPINWPKDMKLAKTLLESYTPEQVEQLVQHFFVIDDAFIKQSGMTFGVFFACIGKVLIDYQRHRKTDAQQQMIRDRQQREAAQIVDWRNMTQEQRDAVKRQMR